MEGKCWFCNRTYQEIQDLVSKLPQKEKLQILNIFSEKTPDYICPICYGIIKRIAFESMEELYTDAKNELLEELHKVK